ncbi:MAG: VOC family protein [Cystobacter sp.]
MDKINPCLWFNGNAEEAARYYVAHIPNSRIEKISRSPGDNPSVSEGGVLMVVFTLAGARFLGLNGGPQFKFNEAVSFHIECEDQAEVDRLTEALSAHPEAEQCGWVKDRFGLSWQLVPRRLNELLSDPDAAKARRTMEAMLEMKRLDIAALERAAAGP